MITELHNRKPARHKDYDYNNEGYYFVTICSNQKKNLLGKIINGNIVLSKTGYIVDECWRTIPKHFHNVELDHYQIMPNHLHGIVIINSVGDANFASLNKNIRNAKFAFPTDRTKMTLSKIIQQFKRQVTIETKNLFKSKIFQRSFYDRIIRNEKELYNIQKYIIDNPLKWEHEKGLPENLYM